MLPASGIRWHRSIEPFFAGSARANRYSGGIVGALFQPSSPDAQAASKRGYGENEMNRQNRQNEDYRRLVHHILDTCPGTTLEQAERIAWRMIEHPELDLLELLTM